jgi:uncharacterized damage-inducible protein DinB
VDTLTPLRDAARQMLHEQKESMRAVVRGLSAESLNWQPAVRSDANSIAQMLSHALDAERFHAAASAGIVLDRDRERHFHVEGMTASDLLALIDRVEQEVDGYLDQLDAGQLGARTSHSGRTETRAWRLLHAIEHSREHIGQALLTRQLWEEQAG